MLNYIYRLECEIHYLYAKSKNFEQALNEIREYIKGAYEMSTYTKSVSLDEENIQDILHIINEVLGDEK